MTSAVQYPTEADLEQLRVLSVLYFVYGGLAALLCLGGLMMVAGGIVTGTVGVATAAAAQGQSDWPWSLLGPAIGGTFMLFVGGSCVVIGGGLAAARILTGLALRRHRQRTLCLVVAVVTAVSLPLGSLLGIATLLVLLRPGVENLFLYGYPVRAAPPAGPGGPGGPGD
jgi:hypothetical protein